MKKVFMLILIIVMSALLIFSLTSCGDEPCSHRDADDNSLCDNCGERYTDEKDLPNEHTHSYTVKNTDSKYLHKAADCENAATYFYSCSCGAKGTTTFTYTFYTRDGSYIYFGEYPQSLKADGVTITSTVDSRGYYLGSDGFYYAKVVAHPCGSGYKFSTGATVSDGATYYFKVEPIRWRILSEDGESAFILCDSIIANHRYDYSSNNYKESEIRAWLNETFYETAFTELQREIILTTTVDNSAYSAGYSSHPYACENTEDKIFLLSYREVLMNISGTARTKQTSDYSRASGAYMNTSSSYYGNGDWWLRSPSSGDCYIARHVSRGGNAYNYYFVYNSDYGVVPALQIRL